MHETNGKLPGATGPTPNPSPKGEGSKSASGLALEAFVWALADDKRAERLLSLTGLTPEGLRSSITERGTQAAILSFLEAYEPDLIACADSIGVRPASLVQARHELET